MTAQRLRKSWAEYGARPLGRITPGRSYDLKATATVPSCAIDAGGAGHIGSYPHQPGTQRPEDRIRRHYAGYLAEDLATQQLALHCEAPALIVGEAKPSPAELLPEHPVLLLEVVDDMVLVAIDPTGHGQEEEMQRVRRAHARSLQPTQRRGNWTRPAWRRPGGRGRSILMNKAGPR